MAAERALITGASGGLGLEFARLFAADGSALVLVARSGDKLDAIAGELRATYNVNVQTIAADLSTFEGMQSVIAGVSECDVLVNNAGFATRGRFDEIDPARVRDEVMLDVLAVTELTRFYLAGMRARGSGRILNIASTAAFVPGPGMAVYYAAKAFVLSFSAALWQETRGSGVTVTCFCPGATDTEFAKRANLQHSMLFRARVAKAAPMARAGYRAMRAGKDVVVPGLSNKIVAFAPTITPRKLLLSVSEKLVE